MAADRSVHRTDTRASGVDDTALNGHAIIHMHQPM